MSTKPCIICLKELQSLGSGIENHPLRGTAFHTSGHYGSTVIDGGHSFEINLCDPCLREAIKKSLVHDSRTIGLWLIPKE